MKLLLCIASLCAATYCSLAQGTVLFQNHPNMDLVRLPGGRPVPAGDDWTVELMAGAAPGALSSAGVTTSFKLPGVFGIGDPPVSLLGWLPGSHPWFEVRLWDNQGGTITSYSQAQASGAQWGTFLTFQLALQGLGDSDGDPPTPPLLGFTTMDTGGWIYADLIGDEVVMHWGRSTILLDVKWELAESFNLEGPWVNIQEAPSPYVVSRFSGGPRYFRTFWTNVSLGLANQAVEATQPRLDDSHDQ